MRATGKVGRQEGQGESGSGASPPQGTLIQHLKEHLLHGDMTSSDIILYYTTVSGRQGCPRGGAVLRGGPLPLLPPLTAVFLRGSRALGFALVFPCLSASPRGTG